MDILCVNFKKIKTNDLIHKIDNKIFDDINSKSRKKLFFNFEQALISGDYLSATNLSIACIHLKLSDFFKFVKKKGLFRYSKYNNGKCLIESIVREILVKCKGQEIITKENSYLNSIVNFSPVYNFYKTIDKEILLEIKKFEKKYPEKSFIKTLLASVDYLFLSNYYPDEKGKTSEINGRTKEEITSAVSYLIFFYTNRIKDYNINTQFVSEKYLKSNEYQKIIVSTCYYLDFREFEILIDHFNYSCIQENNKILIKPPFESFEKAIRLGYIRTDLQKMSDKIETFDVLSFQKLVDDLNDKTSFNFFELAEDFGFKRYRVKMPEPFFEKLVEIFVKPDTLFEEEIIYLSSIFKEQLLIFEDLEKIYLKDNLTLAEFIKIQRIFIIFHLFFTKGIYKVEEIKSDILLRSLIPSFKKEDLYTLLQKVFPLNKIEDFLDLVCWDAGMDFIFDLQYHPILYFDGNFIISLSVMSHSNSIRNAFASEYKRNNKALFSDGKVDHLVNTLVISLEDAGIEYYTQISIGSTDIDVVAIYEKTLFVFECKQSLLPVSIFDLRTTYDYIKKAEKQLDLIKQEFEDGSLIKKIEQKTKAKIKAVNDFHGSVILSNRLFNGNIFKYAVRNIHELTNMINKGKIRTDKGEFHLWPEKKLTSQFLKDYLSLNNQVYNLLFNSLSEKKLIYDLIKPNIEFSTYFLDIKSAQEKMEIFTNKLEKVE